MPTKWQRGSRGDDKEVIDPEGHTIIEHSPVGDSQSNGFVERTVRSFEELLRTHKLVLDQRMKTTVKLSSAAGAWLVEYVADVYIKCHVGPDGKTPFERIKGKGIMESSFPTYVG